MPLHTTQAENTYRKDIQALRAIAILAVIANHLNTNLLGGGFLGVDIFFTVSGYLISGLLFNEYKHKHSLTLKIFYNKRLLRLFPALAFMIVASAFFSSFIMSPAEQSQHAQSGIFSSIWLSNIFFAGLELNYFDSVSKSIFLHTWSLAVEEQFYLLWPLVVLTLINLGKGNGKKLLIYCVLFTTLLFCLSYYIYNIDFHWGFYSIAGRAWQFSLGAAAYALSQHGNIPFKPSTKTYYILLFILALCLYSGNSGTVIQHVLSSSATTLCTAALLILGKKQTPPRAMSSRVIQYTGDISYSLYLWHWPVTLLTKLYLIELSLWSYGAIIVMCYILASLSFYLIENPIRKNSQLNTNPRLSISLILAACLALAFFNLQWKKNSDTLAHDNLQQAIHQYRYDLPSLYQYDCDDWYHSDQLKVCKFNKQGTKTLTLLGDSTVGQWFDVLLKLSEAHNWKLQVITKSSCPIVNASFYYPKINRIYEECDNWRAKAINYLKSETSDLVVISSVDAPFNQKEWIEGTKSALQSLKHNKKMLLLNAPARLSFDPINCIARRQWQEKNGFPPQRCQEIIFASDTATYLKEASLNFENIEVVNIHNISCPNNICVADNPKHIIYRDQVHISNAFALSLASIFEPYFEE